MNPFESPRPRGVPTLQGALRVVLACYCFGVAAARLHQGHLDSLVQFLIQPDGEPNSQVAGISDLVAYGMLICGIITLLRPVHVLLAAIAIYAAGASVAGIFLSGDSWAQATPALQATRWAVPVALLLLDFWPPRIKATLLLCQGAVGLLLIATVATLATQAVICLAQCQHGGAWADLTFAVFETGFRRTVTADDAQFILGVVGAISLATAACLLTSQSVFVRLVATCWGALLAFSPVIAMGQGGYDVALLRASEWGAPLALLIFQGLSIRRLGITYIPENA